MNSIYQAIMHYPTLAYNAALDKPQSEVAEQAKVEEKAESTISWAIRVIRENPKTTAVALVALGGIAYTAYAYPGVYLSIYQDPIGALNTLGDVSYAGAMFAKSSVKAIPSLVKDLAKDATMGRVKDLAWSAIGLVKNGLVALGAATAGLLAKERVWSEKQISVEADYAGDGVDYWMNRLWYGEMQELERVEQTIYDLKGNIKKREIIRLVEA